MLVIFTAWLGHGDCKGLLGHLREAFGCKVCSSEELWAGETNLRIIYLMIFCSGSTTSQMLGSVFSLEGQAQQTLF